MRIVHINRIDSHSVIFFTEFFQHELRKLFNIHAIKRFLHFSYYNQINRKMVTKRPHSRKSNILDFTFVVFTINAKRRKPYRHIIFFAFKRILITVSDNFWLQSSHLRKANMIRVVLNCKCTEQLQFRNRLCRINFEGELVRSLRMDDQFNPTGKICCGGIITSHVVWEKFMNYNAVRVRRKRRFPISIHRRTCCKKICHRNKQQAQPHPFFTNIFHKSPVQKLLKSV